MDEHLSKYRSYLEYACQFVRTKIGILSSHINKMPYFDRHLMKKR